MSFKNNYDDIILNYDKKSEEEFQDMKNEYDETFDKIPELEELVKKLEKDEVVKKYIEASTEKNRLQNVQKHLKKQLLIQKILHCNHYFVINETKREFDGHRTDSYNIYTCIHCGYTNKQFSNYYANDEIYPYNIYYNIMKNTRWMSGIFHGRYDYKDVNELEEIYQKYKGEYPEATDEDCERHIAMVMKMRKK
ncbi:MAG: hypothetical protein IJ094_10600 [Bacilli bacterium]|nr:hypothetical protein [Bacilli bacterium]